MLKRLLALSVLLLSACGGSGSQAPPPAPPLKDASGNLMVVYAGDSLTARLCDPQYAAPYPEWQLDTPLAACAINATTDAVIAMRPGIVVIESGFDAPLDTGALAQEIVAYQQYGAIVILSTLPPGPAAESTNAQVRSLATEYGLQLADYYAGLLDPASVKSAAEYDSALFDQPMMDGAYPTSAGIEIMWDVVCAFLGPDHGEGQRSQRYSWRSAASMRPSPRK